MKALLLLAIVLAAVLVLGVIVLAWLAFGMSYTLTQLLILIKDQDEARRDTEAKAIVIRTARHNRIAGHLTEIVKALKLLSDIMARVEANGAASDDDRKTEEMQSMPPAALGETAPEQPPTMRAHNGQRPALVPEAPASPSTETPRDSDAETRVWSGPPSEGTLVGIGAVPAR